MLKEERAFLQRITKPAREAQAMGREVVTRCEDESIARTARVAGPPLGLVRRVSLKGPDQLFEGDAFSGGGLRKGGGAVRRLHNDILDSEERREPRH